MIWVKGTDLRSEDAKVYEWNGEKFDGLTTIRDAVWGSPDVYIGVWVADEAKRLFALHEAGMEVQKRTLVYDPTEGRYCPALETWSASELFKDPEYLTKHGFRMRQRCADRGTVLHELMYAYSQNEVYSQDDIKYWVNDTVAASYATNNPYRCDIEETTAYCESLNAWLRETGFTPILAEVFAANRKFKYATTIDVVGQFPGDGTIYHMDVKSRDDTTRSDAIQLAAQRYTEFIGRPGTWDEIPTEDILNRKTARSGNILVTPERTRYRLLANNQLHKYFRSFQRGIHEYKSLSMKGVYDRAITPKKEKVAA